MVMEGERVGVKAERTDDTMIGLGADVVEVERMRRALARTPALRSRIFSSAEQAYADEHADPAPHLAARFAAKEAVMKALSAGIGELRFRDIEVQRMQSGAPEIVLHEGARLRQAEAGVSRWHVSLSHTDSTAFAVVIGE